MARIRTIKAADSITGGLSRPSKMPEYAHNIPATACKVGSRLQEVRGSVCNKCYALTNRYRHPAVITAMRRRLEGLSHPDWTPAMALTIGKREIQHMRIHDSGDFQSVEHILNWLQVAQATPNTQYWAPSREYDMVRRAIRGALKRIGFAVPENFVFRMSAHMIGEKAPESFTNTSSVHAARPSEESHLCPASDQENECRDCRACWNPEVKDVAYWLH